MPQYNKADIGRAATQHGFIKIPSEEHKISMYPMDFEEFYSKDYKWENGIHYLPVYMVPFL